jgi:hypothetical protein
MRPDLGGIYAYLAKQLNYKGKVAILHDSRASVIMSNT